VTLTDFQSRATAEGRTAQAIAESVVVGAGFTVQARNDVHAAAGATINLIATDAAGSQWFFDITGSFTSPRAGLLRTDTVWKALGRASTLSAAGVRPIVFLTTNLPERGSVGDRALHSVAGSTFFDAIEMLGVHGKARLRAYARGIHRAALPGFLSADELYGVDTPRDDSLGATRRVPLERIGDPFGHLHDDFKIKGLKHRLQVFLPSQTAAGSAIPLSLRSRVGEEIKSMLGSAAGGCTTQEATGSWVDPVEGVVDERVHVIESYAGQPFPPDLLKRVVNMVLVDLDQAAVAIVLDQDMYHFTRE
jgi:hypothetical protein